MSEDIPVRIQKSLCPNCSDWNKEKAASIDLYRGKPYRYCAFCGTKLVIIEDRLATKNDLIGNWQKIQETSK